MAENILAQLQREPSDFGQLPQSELFHPASTRRAGPPPRLTPRQELDLLNHNLLARQLRTLNPQHPYFSTVRPEGWAPTGRDSMELASIVQSEMRNAGRTEGFPRLEGHHHLPRQFWGRLPRDIDPESEEYKAWILRELHRLKPLGMHTGDQSWNKIWAGFLLKEHAQNKHLIDEQLDKMIVDFLMRVRDAGADSTEE